jgi:hypothetical protein
LSNRNDSPVECRSSQEIQVVTNRENHDPASPRIGFIAACWLVRVALAAAFLSAVADRLGIWGPPGTEGVAWGNVANYEKYVAQLNWYLPVRLVSVVGWIATVCEIVFAVGLLIGWRLCWIAM